MAHPGPSSFESLIQFATNRPVPLPTAVCRFEPSSRAPEFGVFEIVGQGYRAAAAEGQAERHQGLPPSTQGWAEAGFRGFGGDCLVVWRAPDRNPTNQDLNSAWAMASSVALVSRNGMRSLRRERPKKPAICLFFVPGGIIGRSESPFAFDGCLPAPFCPNLRVFQHPIVRTLGCREKVIWIDL